MGCQAGSFSDDESLAPGDAPGAGREVADTECHGARRWMQGVERQENSWDNLGTLLG